MLKLKIIIASTRPGRVGLPIGNWLVEQAKVYTKFDVELIDLAEVNLPLFNEPRHPRLRDYEHDHTKVWSKMIDSADAYIFVIPEYNYFAPATLINAIDYLSHEWAYKPAAIASYGGVSAGTRSAQSIKPLLTSVKLMPIPEGVFIPFVSELIEGNTFKAPEASNIAVIKVLDELLKWTEALKPIRK